jgi:hypothetical protein
VQPGVKILFPCAIFSFSSSGASGFLMRPATNPTAREMARTIGTGLMAAIG